MDNMNVEEEVIYWVTSDLCSSTTVAAAPLETEVSASAIPVALISRTDENLTHDHINGVAFEEPKEEYCVVEEVTTIAPKEKKSRKRGIVWNYFMPTVPDRAQCTFCSAVISYKGKSTNNLLRHLRTKHSENNSKNDSKSFEGCLSEDGTTYFVLSGPKPCSFSPTRSESSFQDEEEGTDKHDKRRGGVWNYFAIGRNKRAKCRFCSTVISYKGGSTTNLLRHMKSKHNNIKVPHKISKPNSSLKTENKNVSSIQHSFAEIVNECIQSDDENEFHAIGSNTHSNGTSNSNDDINHNNESEVTVTTLSTLDPDYTPDLGLQENYTSDTTKERKKSAIAWKYFEMENHDERARCNSCNAVISFKGGSTGNLLRHLKTKHSEIDLTPEKKEEEENIKPECDELAFEAIENKELAKFVQLLNPKYKLRGIPVPRINEKEYPKRIRKRGAALNYFNITSEYGTCQICAANVMLKNGSKAPLLRHLKAKHPDTDTLLVSVGNGSEDMNEQSLNIKNIENIPVCDSSSNSQTKDKITRKMRKRGLVWNHFAPLEEEKAKCITCPAVISYKRGSTSNLLRHMKKKHPEIDVKDEESLKSEEPADNKLVKSENEDDDDYIPSTDGNKKKIVRKRGRVWNHFKPIAPDKARCCLCFIVVIYLKGSTTNLLRHMKKKHPSIDLSKEKPFNKRLIYPKERYSFVEVNKISVEPETLPESNTNTSSSSDKMNAIYRRSEIIFRKHFDKFLNRPVSVTKSKLYDEQLAKMIVKQYCPFTIVESEEFKKFVQTVNPGYSLPSRKTISSRLIPELYEKCVEEVRENLRNIRYVTITTNGWTLVNNECYISITAHFIDDECTFQSYLLDCFKYEEKHTAENLAAEIKNILTDWGLIHKVNAVVSDNAANITAAIRLRSWRHIPCFANMINLVVQSGLFEIRETHSKIRIIVEYLKKNPVLLKKVLTAQKGIEGSDIKLKLDDVSRWDSTYDMFSRLLECKDAIINNLDTSAETLPTLNNYEWVMIQKMCETLKPFMDITNEVSEKNITISKVIPLSRCIGNYLRKVQQEKYLPKELTSMVTKMLEEINLRFSDVEDNTLLAESTLLDPRFKNQAFTNEQSYTNTFHSIMQKAANIKQTDKTEENCTQENDNKAANIWEEFDSRVVQLNDVQNPEAAAAAEIESYVQESLISRTADPLEWWRERKSIYPRLFEMMKQRLCIAATAVSKNFTNGGQLVCEKRNKLSPSKVSMVLFLNHNL